MVVLAKLTECFEAGTEEPDDDVSGEGVMGA